MKILLAKRQRAEINPLTKSTKLHKDGSGRGKQAKEIGLVDEIGGLDTALSIAKKQAGFAEDDKVNLIVLPKQRPFFEQILEQIIEDTEGSIQLPLQFTANHPVLSMLGTPSQHIITWLSLFGFEDGTQIVTILPYDILIR